MDSFLKLIAMIRYKTTTHLLSGIERGVVKRFHNYEAPVLFIVGLPRSGTTLFYQAVVTALNVAYFSNFAADHFHSPIGSSWVMRRRMQRFSSTFSSSYGVSAGWAAPSQGDAIWENLLGNTGESSSLSDEQIINCRDVVFRISNLFSQLFVNKSISLSANIDLISRIFPRALFIVVKRSFVDNAYSQLVNYWKNGTVHDEYGNRWVSAKPNNFDELIALPEVEKIFKQLGSLEAEMSLQLANINKGRLVIIRYEEFCRSPNMHISQLVNFLEENGISVARKSDLPKVFNISQHEHKRNPDILAIKKLACCDN